jgi:hypothetical protein
MSDNQLTPCGREYWCRPCEVWPALHAYCVADPDYMHKPTDRQHGPWPKAPPIPQLAQLHQEQPDQLDIDECNARQQEADRQTEAHFARSPRIDETCPRCMRALPCARHSHDHRS